MRSRAKKSLSTPSITLLAIRKPGSNAEIVNGTLRRASGGTLRPETADTSRLCLLKVTELNKDYSTPRGPLSVLAGISLQLSRGQAAAIMGPSGTGKSTLLHILGALDPPTSGTVSLDGNDPYQLDEKQLAAFRNEKVGFVFQDHCLLPQCS